MGEVSGEVEAVGLTEGEREALLAPLTEAVGSVLPDALTRAAERIKAAAHAAGVAQGYEQGRAEAAAAIRALVPLSKERAAKADEALETAGLESMVLLAALSAAENRHADELLTALEQLGAARIAEGGGE